MISAQTSKVIHNLATICRNSFAELRQGQFNKYFQSGFYDAILTNLNFSQLASPVLTKVQEKGCLKMNNSNTILKPIFLKIFMLLSLYHGLRLKLYISRAPIQALGHPVDITQNTSLPPPQSPSVTYLKQGCLIRYVLDGKFFHLWWVLRWCCMGAAAIEVEGPRWMLSRQWAVQTQPP